MAFDGCSQHRSGTDDMLLAYEVRETAGSHAGREWSFSRGLLFGQGEEIHDSSV